MVHFDGVGDWTHCEAYAKPHLASAYVQCFSEIGGKQNIVRAYCDQDTDKAWKPRRKWITKTEFHLDSTHRSRAYLTVTLDCVGNERTAWK